MMIGPRKRQEDCIYDGTSVFQTDLLLRKNRFSASRLLLAVCDGMGGHAAGETASLFVCEQLNQIDWAGRLSADHIRKTLADIQRISRNQLPVNSGTTIAGVLAGDGRAVVFNAGDSRTYRLLPDSIEYLSHDHTRVQEMVDQSLVDNDRAAHHPLKNLIEFGIGPVFERSWPNHEVYVNEAAFHSPAWYLLCTDGLTDIMTDKQIHELLMPDPVENGNRLYNAVKRKGLKDNTSFIIAEISPP